MSRKQLFNAATLHEDTPGTIRALLGRILPLDVARAIAAPIEENVSLRVEWDGCAEVRPSRRAGPLEFVSPHVTGAVWASLKRHPMTRTTPGAAGERGRLRELESILAEGLPPQVNISRADAPYVVGHVAHLCADLGLDARAAEDPLTQRWTSFEGGLSPRELRVWMAKALEGGSFYPCNARGAELDAEAEEREAQEAARQAVARVEPDGPNTKTDGELGRVTIAMKTSVVLQRDGVPHFLRMAPSDTSAEHTFVSFDRAAFCGAPFREREVLFGVAIMGSDFVRTDHLASAAKQTTHWPSPDVRSGLLQYGRPGKRATREDATWDARTAEGRDRESQFDATCEAMIPSVLAGPPGAIDWIALHMLASAGREGFGLAKDIIAHVILRAAAEAWKARHVKPAGWDENEEARAKSVVFTVGLPERTTIELPSIDADVGTRFIQTWSEPSRTPYERKAWAPPPLPRPFDSEANLLAAIADAPAHFAPDELYVRPAAGVLDRIWSSMTSDPMRAAIEEAIAGKDIIRSSEIEDVLIRAGQVTGELTPAQHTRVHRIMTSAGFKKTERTVDGRRCKVFVRISSEKAAGA